MTSSLAANAAARDRVVHEPAEVGVPARLPGRGEGAAPLRGVEGGRLLPQRLAADLRPIQPVSRSTNQSVTQGSLAGRGRTGSRKS